MYPFVSQVVHFLLLPFTWIIGLIILAVFLPKPKWRRASASAALIIAIAFTNPWLLHFAQVRWEPEPVPLAEIEEPYEAGIVLGGFTNLYATPNDRHHFRSEAGRLTTAIELYHEGKIRHLLIVSGSPSAAEPGKTEAEFAARFARRMGVPGDAIWTSTSSRNTRENATEARRILSEKLGSHEEARCLLITSAIHLRRAVGCFEKAGLNVTPFGTDYRSERHHEHRRISIAEWFQPRAGTLEAWGQLFHEWAGMALYRLRGWI